MLLEPRPGDFITVYINDPWLSVYKVNTGVWTRNVHLRAPKTTRSTLLVLTEPRFEESLTGPCGMGKLNFTCLLQENVVRVIGNVSGRRSIPWLIEIWRREEIDGSPTYTVLTR